ncbi:HK97 gp10 family phage protein [Kribbella catacumbae]|uniref:HK97 gp10 family phage protein n=1 Tax=Kribbella catacumbae TaxID=460086 RepID=UPI00037A2F2B|nr:HK97 gp10 family phage protein [Kribbella catacumbae]
MTDAIKIDGLAEFTRNLKKLDSDLPKALRMAFNAAAEVVVTDARQGIPTKSGKAKASVNARSTASASRVVGGSKRVPYYPWLDFGGRVGKGRSVSRPFIKHGRYIYNAYFDNQARYAELVEQALLDVARQAGIEVD